MELIKWVMLSLVLSGIIGLASAPELSLQWAQGVSGKLTRGDALSYNGYSVLAVDFPSPVISDKYQNVPAEPVQTFVGLNILKNGSIIGNAVLGSGESYVTPDSELRVTATGLPTSNSPEWLYESYSPWATVELDPRGTPSLGVLVNTNGDSYTSSSDTDIVATVEIQNTGTADAMNVEMNIISGLEVTSGSLKYDYPTIKKGESVTQTIAFKLPYVLKQQDYSILANVSWYDVMNTFSSRGYQKAVTVAPEPKSTSLSIRKSVDSKIYLGDSALVSISVKNHRKDDLNNISITDSPPAGFSLIGNTTLLHWIADIPAGGDWDIHYVVKPQDSQIDGIDLPPAIAVFTLENENYSIQSGQPHIKVYGPKIVLTKRANVPEINPGDTVTMTVVAQNTGNTPTKVIVNDTLPENAILVSGNTTYEAFLGSNANTSFSYSIRIADPPITLPPGNASYFEPGNKGGKINAVSQEVIINKKARVVLPEPTPQVTIPDPTPEPTPVPTATPVPTNTPDVKQSESSNDINDILDFLFACDNSSVNPTIKSKFCTEGIQ